MASAWQNVAALADKYGLTMQRNTKSNYSRLAHEGVKFAEKQGKTASFVTAVFAAQWQDGLDINDLDTLVRIGDGVGLDSAALENSLSAHVFEADVVRDGSEANYLGIHAVPCFLVGSKAIMGVQPRSALLELLEEQTL